MFSKACEYGLKAMICIAGRSQQSGLISLDTIAKEIDSPVSFTAKILQKLVKENLVESAKGPGGGFHIPASKLDKIWLSQVVNAIDGDHLLNGCALGFKRCNEHKPCALHYRFKTVRNDLKLMMSTTNLKELSNDIINEITFLKSK